jgi:hypothetical protein
MPALCGHFSFLVGEVNPEFRGLEPEPNAVHHEEGKEGEKGSKAHRGAVPLHRGKTEG